MTENGVVETSLCRADALLAAGLLSGALLELKRAEQALAAAGDTDLKVQGAVQTAVRALDSGSPLAGFALYSALSLVKK